MDINLQTKVAELLKAYPQLEDKLIDISPTFAKLKNPILRSTIAKVATLKQIAEIANIPAPELIQLLRKEAGLTTTSISQNDEQEKQPSWLEKYKVKIIYDACPVIEGEGNPMPEILKQTKLLNPGEIMLLKTPFKPAPMIDMLKSSSFEVWYEEGNTYIYKPNV